MTQRAWRKYQVGKVYNEQEKKQRQLRATLNKLTFHNFDKLSLQIKQLRVDSSVFTHQVHDRAVTELIFCEMYVDLCRRLAAAEEAEEGFPLLGVDDLVKKCLGEFERRGRDGYGDVDGDGDVQLPGMEEEKRVRARRRMLGNVTLIGELYRKGMLTEGIIHECIRKLLGGSGQIPGEEDIEALCVLITRTGDMLDNPRNKEYVDAYFDQILKLYAETKLSSRVRFLLLDVIDLRRNKWQQRRKEDRPYRIEEVQRHDRSTNPGVDAAVGRVTFSSVVASDESSPGESMPDMSKASIGDTFGQDKYDD